MLPGRRGWHAPRCPYPDDLIGLMIPRNYPPGLQATPGGAPVKSLARVVLLLPTVCPVRWGFVVASVERFDTPDGMLRGLPERAPTPPPKRCILIFDHVAAPVIAFSTWGYSGFLYRSNPIAAGVARLWFG